MVKIDDLRTTTSQEFTVDSHDKLASVFERQKRTKQCILFINPIKSVATHYTTKVSNTKITSYATCGCAAILCKCAVDLCTDL